MNSLLDRFRLDGRSVVITGASGGLGVGFARSLGGAGARLTLAARRLDELHTLAGELRGAGIDVLVVRTDVTDPQQCSALVSAAKAEFGAVDVLVNNAGLGTAVPALRETPEQFRQVIDVNLEGAYWMAQACARVMTPGSSIVNISSMLALVKSVLPQAAYAASKAGLIGLTRDLSTQWAGRRGIRVNAVAPGYFESDMTAAMDPGVLGAFLDGHCPLGRVGEQEELDAAVLFLASRASSYITGVTLAVDGGISTH